MNGNPAEKRALRRFNGDCLGNDDQRGRRQTVPDTLVDTGSEYTWVPRAVLESLGIVPQRKQAFLVVFAEPGDMVLLGVHSLEGLNLKVDPVRKELVPAGPVIAARAA